MLPAPIPDNEFARLASLRRMQLLSTPDEAAFDRVTRTAQRLFDVPVALVSLIDAERQWFKSCIGLPVRETPRAVSFCGHAILDDELLVVEDARADVRFADNPIVTGEPHVVFYAGRPLRNSEVFNIGTLCVIDHAPRLFSPDQRQSLDDLGHWLETVLLNRELGEAEQAMIGALDELRRTSLLDEHLNIWRREAILDLLARETERAFRGLGRLGLMQIRIDGGPNMVPPLRQEVYAELCRRARALLHAYDSIGLLADGEFIAILPDAGNEWVQRTAEKLVRAVAMSPFAADGEVVSCSASIGWTTVDYAVQAATGQELLARLARAVAAASAYGGNRASCIQSEV